MSFIKIILLAVIALLIFLFTLFKIGCEESTLNFKTEAQD